MAALCFGAGGEELSESTVLITTRWCSRPRRAHRQLPVGFDRQRRADAVCVGSARGLLLCRHLRGFHALRVFQEPHPTTLCLWRVLIALSTVLLPYNNVQFAFLKHSYFPSFFLPPLNHYIQWQPCSIVDNSFRLPSNTQWGLHSWARIFFFRPIRG